MTPVDKQQLKPLLKLVGTDGNAFAVLGAARRAAIKAKWPVEQIEEFLDEARSGDYENLLATCMKYFDVR